MVKMIEKVLSLHRARRDHPRPVLLHLVAGDRCGAGIERTGHH